MRIHSWQEVSLSKALFFSQKKRFLRKMVRSWSVHFWMQCGQWSCYGHAHRQRCAIRQFWSVCRPLWHH